jgi:urease accessory protein
MNRMKQKSYTLLATALFLGAIPAARAHPGLESAAGFAGGLAHPFTGWDHILAMIAVGFWAAQLRATRLLPAAFLAAMALGALAGRWIGPVPGVEKATAASVLVLGLLIALQVRVPRTAGAAWVGAFAMFHGAAHGAEAHASPGALLYGCGFLAATAVLLASGVAAGNLAARLPARASRAPGWVVAAAGLVLLVMAAGITS